jgi:hypothetical protein
LGARESHPPDSAPHAVQLGGKGQCAQFPAPCSVGSSSAYEVGERSGEVPCDARRAAAEKQDSGPSDIAKATLFLLLDPSAALNGRELIADGGLTMSFEFRTGSEGASI